MAVEPAHVETAAAMDVLASIGDATRYVSASAERDGWGGPGTVVATSLEEQTLDALVAAETRVDGTTVVGIGGGLALDTAKYVGLKCGKDVVLIPTALSSLAPFTTEIARRIRRQITWIGDISPRVVLDWPLLAKAPAARNRAGAAEVVATLSASWDWRLADARDKGLPASARALAATGALRSRLGDAADDIRAASPDGLAALAGLLEDLATLITDVGHRRMVDGSEHTFAQAFEHRLGRLGGHDSTNRHDRTGGYGEMVGLGTVAMSALQAWFGLSAGGPVDPDTAVDLLSRCGVACNPHQLDVDEGTFRGVLRHTVRFAVGEFLPYSVLNEADVNFSAAEEMWRWCWRVPRVAG